MEQVQVTLIPGDGIGPELVEATKNVISALNVPIVWDVQEAGADILKIEGTPLPQRVLDSIKKNKVALKGPITTPIATGFRSVNVALRKELDLYACLRPCKSMIGVKTPFENIDIVVVRENTEDLYAGIERWVDDDTAESIKRITRSASTRIARFAFEYAQKFNRKKVSAITKANICKFSDGLFLEAARSVAKEFPNIAYEEVLVDALCMQLVQNPHQFDVLLLPNLYGDIVSDLTAGLVGGLGVAPGANHGLEAAVFEPVHGSAPSLKGQHKVNPTALLLSAALMLEHLGWQDKALQLKNAVFKTIQEGRFTTFDLGGSSSTFEMSKRIIELL